jgi:hypothetical protein
MTDHGEAAYEIANAAMERMDVHEKLCGERYAQIVANQAISAQDRTVLRELLSSKFEKLYGFLWKIAFAVIGTLFTALAGIIVWLLNNSVVWRQPY